MPLTIVYKEDIQKYINALQETRQNGSISIFVAFMFKQTENFLQEQVATLTKNQTSNKKGKGFAFLF